MNSRKMNTLALSAACLALALTITACSGDKANTSNQTASSSPSPSEIAVTPPAPESPSASPSSDPEVKTAEGEFTGMIDGHSVEIKLDGKATPFQIDMNTADKVSEWKMGTRVKFQYSVENMNVDGQQIQLFTIEEIDKA